MTMTMAMGMRELVSGTGGVPPVGVFLVMYLGIYLLSFSTPFQSYFPSKHRPESSSCLMSLFHGTPAVILSSYALLHHTHPNPLSDFCSPNTPFQDLVLDFSIAYFTMDLLHYLLFLPGEILFIAHHLATLFVFTTCRFLVSRGGSSLLLLLLLAELTSACQNLWTLASFSKEHDPRAAHLYASLSPLFYSFYTLARGLLGPIVVFRMWAFYLRGGGHALLPAWLWFCWLIVISGAIIVSLLWVSNLWILWFRDNARQKKDNLSKLH